MRSSELNVTELWSYLEACGVHLPRGTDRERLVEAIVALPADGPRAYQPTRIDLYRWEIISWAIRVWPRIYDQVSCPLSKGGCFTCSDFRVVGCLVNNPHVFDVSKKEMEMANWGKILVTCVSGDLAKAGPLLKAEALEPLPEDGPAKAIVYRIAEALLDRVIGGAVQPVPYYTAKGMTKEELPRAWVFMASKTLPQALLGLAEVADGRIGPPAPAAAPAAAPPAAAAAPTATATPAPATASRQMPPAREAGYFPGVAVTEAAPSQPAGPDAELFFKEPPGQEAAAPPAVAAAPAPAATPAAPPPTPPPAAEKAARRRPAEAAMPDPSAPPAPAAAPPPPTTPSCSDEERLAAEADAALATGQPLPQAQPSLGAFLDSLPKGEKIANQPLLVIAKALEEEENLLLGQAHQLMQHANTLRALIAGIRGVAYVQPMSQPIQDLGNEDGIDEDGTDHG